MDTRNKQSYYEILDVSLNANPEVIRMAYIRAKNAYNRDSLAAYSLFDREESKNILSEIEEAYAVLSDSEKRRKYDESHGIVSSESVYDAYHKGNHAVQAFSRESLASQMGDGFTFEDDPFRKPIERHLAEARAAESPAQSTATAAQPSPIERLRAAQENAVNPKNFQLTPRDHQTNPEMEEKIKTLQSVNGAFLKSVREYKNVSQDEIMNIIKISKNYLNALEGDDLAKLPAAVFVRGFVIQYAKALKIDQEKTATSYMEFFRAKRPN